MTVYTVLFTPSSGLGYRTPREFAEDARGNNYGKDGDGSALENDSAFASGVSRFPTAPATGIFNNKTEPVSRILT